MKIVRFLTLLLTALMAVGSACAQSTYSVALGWVNDSTPTCTATVKTFCAIGRTLRNVTGGGSTVIAGPTVITPGLTSYTTPPAPYTAPVTQLYTMTTNYQDGTGAVKETGVGTCGTAGTAGPCSVQVFFVLPPSNITVTPVQVSALVESSAEAAGMM